MIHFGLQARRVVADDQRQISNLIFHEANVHRHLDWSSPLDWIGSPNYWALEEYGRVVAALACPEDPPRMAWIRFFGYQPHLSGLEAWSAVWEAARNDMLRANAQTQISAIVTKQWLQNLLLASGFELRQNIILLQLMIGASRSFPAPQGFRMRPMQAADMPAVTEVDYDAFGWFWHNAFATLQRARAQSISATVAENDSGVIGYQITAGNSLGAHLVRLAVKREAQGKGVGAALVSDLIPRLDARRLSVNTQEDNVASLALYEKLGFVRTGERFPVLVYPTGI